MSTPRSSDLASRSISAAAWNYLGTVVRALLQFVTQIALARLLGQEAFGVIAAALAVLFIYALVIELGLGSALIQAPALDEETTQFVFTCIVIAAAVGAMVVGGCADLVAAFFEAPEAALVLRVMVFAFFVQGLGIVSLSLLRRDLHHKAIQHAQLSGYVSGFVVIGVLLAAAGAGVWSLVAAWLVQNVVTTTLMYRKTRHSLKLSKCPPGFSLQRFGAKVMATNICNYLTENLDRFFVGRCFGTATLGAYSVSYNLVRTPTNNIVTSLQQVLFPTAARAGDQTSSLQIAFLASVWGVALVTFSVFFSIAAIGDTFIEGLLGSEWRDASVFVTPLAIAMPFHALMAICGPILWGRGAVASELYVQLGSTTLLAAVLTVASNFSAEAMAWGLLAVYVCRCVVMLGVTKKHLSLSLREIADSVFPALAVSTSTTAAVWALVYVASQHVSNLPVQLIIGILTGAFSWLSSCWLLGNWLIPRCLVKAFQAYRLNRSARIQRVTERFFHSSVRGR